MKKIIHFAQNIFSQRNLIIFLGIILIVACTTSCYAKDKMFRVHYLNVGSGDAVLIEFPDNTAMMIDGADPEYGNMITKYLQSLNVPRLSTVIVTHPHNNHYGGFLEVVKHIPVDRVYINGDERIDPPYAELMSIFEKNNVSIEMKKRGQKISGLPRGVSIDILHPEKLIGNINENSIAIWVRYKRASFVFWGDIGPKEQDEVFKRFKNIKGADCVMWPAHGDPVSQTFLDAHKNAIVVISTAGKGEIPGTNKLEGGVVRTSQVGHIIVETDGKKVNLVR